MSEWKEAFFLATFEFKKSLVNLTLGWLGFFALSLIIFILYNHFDSPDPYHDFIFLILLSSGPFLLRNNYFKNREMSHKSWFSPILLMQMQLPISKRIIAKSRLITYAAYLFPFLAALFPMLYLIDNELGTMGIVPYIAFCLIWIAFCFSFGMLAPVVDVGFYYATKNVIIYSLVGLSIAAVFILIYHFYVPDDGIVLWIAALAQKWPLTSMFISIVLIHANWMFWPLYMQKQMKKLDYM